ncbi:hypothetical protein VE02_02291 [Pseudogymnoascus sp. 03VT05]|nr:hypothetical protein VE02_02291 [Pseudogymnoascus sp. 03VT05]
MPPVCVASASRTPRAVSRAPASPPAPGAFLRSHSRSHSPALYESLEEMYAWQLHLARIQDTNGRIISRRRYELAIAAINRVELEEQAKDVCTLALQLSLNQVLFASVSAANDISGSLRGNHSHVLLTMPGRLFSDRDSVFSLGEPYGHGNGFKSGQPDSPFPGSKLSCGYAPSPSKEKLDDAVEKQKGRNENAKIAMQQNEKLV